LQPRTRPDGAPEGAELRAFAATFEEAGREAFPFAASATLHAALVVALAFVLPLPSLPPLPRVESIAVELLSEDEIARLTTREEPAAEPSPPATLPALVAPWEPPLVLAHAETLYSDTALNRSARRALTRLAIEARFEQLCDVEAMEQIARSRREFRPERAVAYATADVRVSGNLMVAEGAAFLSEGQWYKLSFRCETTTDRSKVVSFDFATGGLVTEGRGLGTGTAD
jgi:hypothetical protein